jgi:tetratricopeptide (TPR) repeat protein
MRNLILSVMAAGLLLAAGRTAWADPPAAEPAAPEAEGPRTSAAPEAPLAPDKPDAAVLALRHFVRGRLYMNMADNPRAAAEFREAVALAADIPQFWVNLGLTAHDSGHAAEAVAALDKAISLAPDDPPALYYRARIARIQNDAKMAGDLLKHLLDTAPRSSPFRILATFHLAQVLQEAKDLDGALALYESLLESLREPQGYFQRYPDLVRLFNEQIQLRDTVGRLYLMHGDSDKAISTFKGLLEEQANNPTVLSLPSILNLLCLAHLQKKDYDGARTWARKMVEAKPDDGGGYQRLMEIYRAEGKPADVIPELEQYHRAHGDNRMATFQLAEAYKAFARSDEAAALYREILTAMDKTTPAAKTAAIKLAELESQAKRPVEALAALAAVLDPAAAENDPVRTRAVQVIATAADPARLFQEAQSMVGDDNKDFRAFVLVGLLAEFLKRPDDALALYDKALARDPKAMVAYSQKAGALIQAQKLGDAMAVYEVAVKAGAAVGPDSRRKMGMLLEYLKRPAEALEQYRLAHAGAPLDKTYWYLLSGMLVRTGNLDEAEKELLALLKIAPGEDEAYAQLAVVYTAKGDFPAAEKAAAQAEKLKPEALAPKVLMLNLRIEQKRFEDAEQLARALLKDHPDAAAVRLTLSEVLAREEKYKDAAAELQTVLGADAGNVELRYRLSNLYSFLGDHAAAEKELERILAVKPDYAPASNDLGYVWADRGVHLDQAEKMIRQALKSEPQSPTYLDSLGWVLYKQSKFEDAVTALKAATGAAPDLDSVLWDHLGDTCWRLNQPAEATKAWEAAVRLLKAQKDATRAADLDRVEKKVQAIQAGQPPAVAPLGEK